MDELEKVDLIRKRMGVSYREAREALEAAGGDVVQALVHLEESGDKFGEKLQEAGHEIAGQLKGILHKGRVARIKVKQGDKTVFEVPASLGAVGLLGVLASSQLAVLGAIGSIAAMSRNYSLEFEKAEPGDEG